MLEHGGRLREAAVRWGIPATDWLDLSTGIAPWAYPVPPLTAAAWQRLPEDDDGLEAAARAYYGAEAVLPLPGSQAAIMALPRLRPAGLAAVLAPCYAEHAAAWRTSGHALQPFAGDALAIVATQADAVVVANPNNPDGTLFPRERLLAAARELAERGGWLAVDEAFADADGAESLAAQAGRGEARNVVVLRSLGKFFGLAGARVGFAIGEADLLDRLRESLGPWAVSHPAREVARAALLDVDWQTVQRERLRAASQRLAQLLRDAGLGEPGGTALFRYVATPRAPEVFEALARRGILVRAFAAPAALRVGLPGAEAEWQRLAVALAEIR